MHFASIITDGSAQSFKAYAGQLQFQLYVFCSLSDQSFSHLGDMTDHE